MSAISLDRVENKINDLEKTFQIMSILPLIGDIARPVILLSLRKMYNDINDCKKSKLNHQVVEPINKKLTKVIDTCLTVSKIATPISFSVLLISSLVALVTLPLLFAIPLAILGLSVAIVGAILSCYAGITISMEGTPSCSCCITTGEETVPKTIVYSYQKEEKATNGIFSYTSLNLDEKNN
ncbi:hypothetical protein BN1013_02008 [Candidatus Rubidus massiliensis]|nr:hypothetical protein BN1013_02008 [Candidatus Rubidus massiliensis]